MSDLKAVIDATKKIETLLVERFGAAGRGLHEKLTSVERRVPEDVARAIRYLATVRNQAVHEDGFEVEDVKGFVSKAAWVVQRLESQPATLPGDATAPSEGGGKVALTLATIIGIFIALFVLLAPKHRAPVSAPVDEVAERADTQPAPATPAAPAPTTRHKQAHGVQSAGPARSTEGPAQPADAEPEAGDNTTVAATPPASRGAATTEGTLLSNQALKLLAVHPHMGTDGFSSSKLVLDLDVENTSGQTLAGGSAEALLFINGAPAGIDPATDLYLYFGDSGLRDGERRTVHIDIDSFHHRDWVAPDVVNASTIGVAVRVASTDDGMKKPIGGDAPRFAIARTGAKSAKAAGAAAQQVDMAGAISSGHNVGAGNGALKVTAVRVALADGSFSSKEFRLDVDVENVSDKTISWVTGEAKLFLNGQKQPAATADTLYDRPGKGDRGLAAGQHETLHFTIDSFHHSVWLAPDAINAGSRLVAFRIAETQDGLNHTFGGSAMRFPWR